jgi:hypothetical protein
MPESVTMFLCPSNEIGSQQVADDRDQSLNHSFNDHLNNISCHIEGASRLHFILSLGLER